MLQKRNRSTRWPDFFTFFTRLGWKHLAAVCGCFLKPANENPSPVVSGRGITQSRSPSKGLVPRRRSETAFAVMPFGFELRHFRLLVGRQHLIDRCFRLGMRQSLLRRESTDRIGRLLPGCRVI